MLPFWSAVAAHPRAAGAVAGVNAAVVGLLAAAFIDPIAVTAIDGVADVAIALTGLAALQWRRTPPLAVVLWCVAARLGAGLLGWA